MNQTFDLTTPKAVADYMKVSANEQDWNERCDKVKAANGGNYPQFWFTTIVLSGLAGDVSGKW